MPSRAFISFLLLHFSNTHSCCFYVSMPSRAFTLFLQLPASQSNWQQNLVSMPSRAFTSFLQNKKTVKRYSLRCQCPLGLLLHFYLFKTNCVMKANGVSMPSRAFTSFLQYPFKNLGFMRLPEPIFAGICQNILIAAYFHACS